MDAKNKIWELWQSIKKIAVIYDNLSSRVTDNETTFRNELTTETNRAKAAEKTNADAIAANKTAIDNLETTKLNKADYHPYDGTNVLSYIDANKTALASEVTRAKAAEKVNADAIAKNKSAIDILNGDSTVDGSVKKAIKDVVGAAPEALNILGEIATELTNHENAAAAITTAIATETNRAKGAEKTLTDSVNTEVTRAKAAEADRYTKSETYSKTELNNMITTPNQQYVTVATYASLPASGSEDTIYRVSNYDGSQSQVAADVYSEYAWDGTQYIFLCVKSAVGEVFDISAYHNNAKYADLNAALTSNTGGVPQSLQKGGMSVKFVQSSDNKYVQYRLIADEFTTDTKGWAISEEGVYVENPEFVYVKTDAEGKILWAIKKDGGIYYGVGVPQQVIDYINEKIAELVLDEYEDIVAFLNDLEKGDKTLQDLLNEKVDKEEGKSLIDEGFAASQSVIEDPESRHEIMLDSEEKIISYRKEDGTKVENIGIETPNITAENISAEEVNIEGGEATLEKATLNSLELTNEGMTEFQRALKDSGFRPGGAGDWSDYISGDGDNPLCIPEPRCAMINITNSSGNFVWPTSKPGQSDYQKGINADKEAIFEFWDMQGNYFKKTINISAQGRSSMVYPKKNAGFDLFDSEYDGDAFSVRFGNWPAMDSYHLKAYYTDFFRGAAIVAYKFAMEVDGTYPVNKDKNWKKALLDKYDFGTCTADGKQLSDLSLQVDTGALCMPDGFPCIVYANGAFYGVYSFNIKKARDNYHMKKSNPKHIHLDGTLNGDTIFINPNNPSHNTINWGAFEIRNPKNLVYATAQSYTEDGETKTTYKYDADIKQAEIAGNADGSDAYSAWQAGSYPADVIVGHNGHYFINTVEGNDKEPVYDKSKNADDSPDFKNKTKCGWLNCTNTIKVKNSIIQFSKYWKAIQDKSGAEARREELEKYFDSKNLIDYYIVQLVTGDSDGFGSNWQWTTWDGEHWYVNEYDKDMVFGANFTGAFTMPPFMSWVNTDYRFSIFSNTNSSYNGVMPYIYNYYKTEIKDRYKELRDKGIITVDNIINKLVDWINRIGVLNLEKEYAKWSYSPCNMLPILNDGWEFYKYESFAEYSSIANYDSSITYNAGDKCKYGYTCFIATKSISGVVPAQRISHCDNIYRIENWIKERIALEDSYLEYNV